jgi:hypothetical protein
MAAVAGPRLTWPMMTNTGGTPEYELLAPLDTDTDVLDRVDQLISLDARRDRSLWLMFLAADAVQLPVVVPIDDVPANPDPRAAGSICDVIACVLNDAAPGGSVVITLARDNGRAVTESDQRWFTALQAAAAQTGISLRMFCLATPDAVRRLDPTAESS